MIGYPIISITEVSLCINYNDYNSEKKTDNSWDSSRLDSGTSVVHYLHK